MLPLLLRIINGFSGNCLLNGRKVRLLRDTRFRNRYSDGHFSSGNVRPTVRTILSCGSGICRPTASVSLSSFSEERRTARREKQKRTRSRCTCCGQQHTARAATLRYFCAGLKIIRAFYNTYDEFLTQSRRSRRSRTMRPHTLRREMYVESSGDLPAIELGAKSSDPRTPIFRFALSFCPKTDKTLSRISYARFISQVFKLIKKFFFKKFKINL